MIRICKFCYNFIINIISVQNLGHWEQSSRFPSIYDVTAFQDMSLCISANEVQVDSIVKIFPIKSLCISRKNLW